VEPLSIYMIGPDMEDFDHTWRFIGPAILGPRGRFLVMNESLGSRRKNRAGAFDVIVNPLRVQRVGRGGKQNFLFIAATALHGGNAR